MGEAKILTVAGKGGVGKTAISSAMVRILTERYPEARILAIDADPAIGLTTALGVEPADTLDGIRMEIVESVEDGHPKEAIEMLNEARYRILDTMVEERGFCFLAIGRPEAAGCYCKINAYLKDVISMLADDFDYVVIDGEAGIEQINRRVMEKVTHLFLVTDPSSKGLKVIETIKGVADDLVMYDSCGVIVNRIREAFIPLVRTETAGILAYIPDDAQLAENDMRGASVFDLPAGSPVMKGVEEALSGMGLIS